MEDFDLENPLTSSKSQEQDQTDTISELFASESDHMPSKSHFQSLKSQYSLVSVRRDSTSSIVEVKEKYRDRISIFLLNVYTLISVECVLI